jgi:hypothetical protein
MRLQRSKHCRLLKNTHLLRCPRSSSLNVRFQYASLLRPSGALHLAIFEQPDKEPERSKTVYSQKESCSSAFGQ